MVFELRVETQVLCICETAEEALIRVRQLMRADPDSEPEVFDLTTGRPYGPAASREWREELARALGY